MMNKTHILSTSILVIALQVFFIITNTGCSTKTVDNKAEEVKNVKTFLCKKTNMNIDLEYPGKTKSVNQVSITSEVSGKVEKVCVDIGDEVKEGQVLFTLDSKTANDQLKQSQESANVAIENYQLTRDSTVPQQLTQAQGTFEQAQIQYNDAKSMYEKVKVLYERNGSSKKELDDADSKFKNSEIQLNSAKKNLDILSQKQSTQLINVADSQYKSALTSLELASKQLDKCTIKSPISGKISMKNLNAGELVSNAQPVLGIIGEGNLCVDVYVPDKSVKRLQIGQSLKIEINSSDNKEYTGKITRISPSADDNLQLYLVRVEIGNLDNLMPDMFARVQIPIESKENIIAVPNEAIVIENGVNYVYTVLNDKVNKKAVTTGLSTEQETEITQNLGEDEYVITEGQSFLNDKQSVMMIK